MPLETPAPRSALIVERYGSGGFRIGGTVYTGAILVFADRVEAWPVDRPAEIDIPTLAPAICHGGVEILLIGCGRVSQRPARTLVAGLKAHGIAVEAMDTGAACRTYGVLALEGRLVAAALLPF